MMDWTDRHCRYFHRLLAPHARLYTEMVHAHAVIRGDRARLLGFDASEHPVALQLGGSDPALLAQAAAIGEQFGYDEVNLNVGCPSERVQSGSFGACLMREPRLVGDCVAAMRAAVRVPVTVKCRIGVDEQDEYDDLERFIATVSAAGCTTFVVHARKAWLKGLSPKENREIPPLVYERVHRLKREHPRLAIVINGGIATAEAVEAQLAHVDGVMIGRAAYQDPYLLTRLDARLFAPDRALPTRREALDRVAPYAHGLRARGERLHHLTRHMVGLFQGEYGARAWRRVLSTEASHPDAGWDAVERAYAATRAPLDREAA
jgi:tRNA-dihydrouridine synthase A